MGNDPNFVRLVDRMARSTQVDLNSGWSIAGLDVRPFPGDDEPLAQRYVRDAIRRGTVEGCSQAEYEEVYGDDGTDNHDFMAAAGYKVEVPTIKREVQVTGLRALAEQERHRIEAARGLTSGGESGTDERIRKAAILRAQQAANKGEEVDDLDAAGEAVDDDVLESAGVDESEAPKPKRQRSSRAAGAKS